MSAEYVPEYVHALITSVVLESEGPLRSETLTIVLRTTGSESATPPEQYIHCGIPDEFKDALLDWMS